jgi:CRP-like cAMP-binding protein
MNLSGSDQDLFSEDWGRGKSRAKLIKNFSMDFDVDEDDDDDDNYCWDGDNEFDDKNAPSFDADEDEDEGEDEDSLKDNIAPDADRSNTTTARAMSNPQFLTMKKEMLHFVSKMSIFSYLSDDAFKECLIHMRYIDLPQSGSAIAYTNLDTDSQPSNTDNTEIDGSLYVVISGAVDCSCQLVDREINKMNDDHCDSSKSQHAKLQFTAGPGDLVTSQLAMISDLVRLYQQEKNDADMGTPRSIHPVRVNAHTSTPNTRLICVPSHAFLSVLKKFPHEVHQLTQTILGRTQRVTLQTLVKSLGLTNEIMSRTDRTLNDKMICSQQRNSDLKHQFQMCQQECRNMCNDEKLQLDTSNEVTALKVPNEIKRIVATAAAWQLGGDSDENIHILEKHSSIIAVQPGSVLVRAGGRSEYVYFVVEGEIEVGNFITKGLSKNSTRYLGFSITGQSFNANIKTDGVAASFQVSHLVHSGAILSEMSTFVGEVSMLTSRASSQLQYPSLLLQISKSTYFSLLHRNTTVLIQSLSSILKNDFSPMVHLLDWGLKWRDVQAGSILAEKGEPCGSLWVVLNGRLRSGTKHEGNAVMKHEYGRGACIGDVQVLTGDEWPNDVYAIRNSELAELPVHVLEFIMHMFPSCGVHFARIIANQVQQRYMKKDKFALNKSDNGLPSYKLSVATVAIIPVCFRSNHDSALKFCENVISSLEKIAPCALMTKALVKKKLGKVHNVKNFSHDLKLSRLLGDLEENNRLVAFQAEPSFNWWTKICIQQSDCVLLVVDSEKAPECARLQRYLSLIQGTRLTKRVEMVILSKEEKDGIEGVKPISKELKEWIERLPFNTTNHLIRLLKTKADIINKNDMNRMCRRITGCSLGLVLGGGGARGIAHLGVIKALLEAGVQVDLVGGSSQGAFIGVSSHSFLHFAAVVNVSHFVYTKPNYRLYMQNTQITLINC